MNKVSATVLATFEIFKRLDKQDRDVICEKMRLTDVEAGQFVISNAQRQTDVYFLVSGRVRVCAYSPGGKQVQFEDLTSGMMFGELAAIDNGERSSDCVAMEPSQIAVMSSEQFRQLIHDYAEVCDAVMLRLVGMVRRHMGRVYEYGTTTVAVRVRLELLRMCSEHHTGSPHVEIKDAPTHSDIASRIGSHREAVTRELKVLEKMGVITWRPRAHIIHNVAQLTELVDQ